MVFVLAISRSGLAKAHVEWQAPCSKVRIHGIKHPVPILVLIEIQVEERAYQAAGL